MSEAPRELESFRNLYPMTWATPTQTRRHNSTPYQEHSPRVERWVYEGLRAKPSAEHWRNWPSCCLAKCLSW